MIGRLSDLATGVGRFFVWWGGELAGTIPVSLRGIARRRTTRLDIWVSRDETIIERIHADGGERYSDATSLDHLDDESWSGLGELAQAARCRLILSRPDIYATSIHVPKAARGRIDSIVDLQLDDIAPIPRDHLQWALGPVASDADQVTASVVMARRDRLAQLAELTQTRAGIDPEIVALVDGQLVTLARPTGRMGDTIARRLALAIGAIAMLTPILIWLTAICLTWIEHARTTAIADAARDRLVLERRAQVNETLRAAVAVVARTRPAAQILDDLADRLPDDVIARSLARDPSGVVEVKLATADPEALRPIMARNPLFRFTEVDQLPEEESGRMHVTFRGSAR